MTISTYSLCGVNRRRSVRPDIGHDLDRAAVVVGVTVPRLGVVRRQRARDRRQTGERLRKR